MDLLPPTMFGFLSQKWQTLLGLSKNSSLVFAMMRQNPSGPAFGLMYTKSIHIVRGQWRRERRREHNFSKRNREESDTFSYLSFSPRERMGYLLCLPPSSGEWKREGWGDPLLWSSHLTPPNAGLMLNAAINVHLRNKRKMYATKLRYNAILTQGHPANSA